MKREAKLELNPSHTTDIAVHPAARLNGTHWLTVSMEGRKHTTCKPKLRALGKKKKKFLLLLFLQPLYTACNSNGKTRSEYNFWTDGSLEQFLKWYFKFAFSHLSTWSAWRCVNVSIENSGTEVLAQGHLTTRVELSVELATPNLHSLLLTFLDSRPPSTEIQTAQYPIHFSKS